MSSVSDKLSYARSLLITAPLICLYTAVMGSLSLISSLFDAKGRAQHTCSRVWSRLILATARVRVKVLGVENLRENVPYVLCVNHQSHMDIPIVLASLPIQFRFAAKKELFRIPFLGWHLARSGHVPIDRENPRSAIRSMSKAAQTIKSGTPVAIFPEGGTTEEEVIRPFKGGAFFLATKSAADVVPVTIRGSRRVLLPKTFHVRSGNVEVVIGRPIPSEGSTNADLANMVRQEMLAAFAS